MRTLGVEEELLLVDPTTGEPRALAAEVLRAAEVRARDDEPSHGPGGTVDHELQRQQIETDTPPREDLDDIADDLRGWRERVRLSALESGARVLASGVSPLDGKITRTRGPRYDAMAERFRLTLAEQLVCGCHVHVGVESDEEAVTVLDRIGRWLPVLHALSTNSPWWQGKDTGYASFRAQMMTRWPTGGPTPHFGSVEAYRGWVDRLVASGVATDEGMIYTDARAAASYPTVELRVADVCLDVRDTVVVAGLCRALVDTAAAQPLDEAPGARDVVRVATWQASRYGLAGDLVDPRTGRPAPAREVVEALLEQVDDALGRLGDRERLHRGVDELFERGSGAERQQALFAERDPADAVLALARITAGEE